MSESLKSDLRKVQVLALEVAVEALQEECEELRSDAERYRWLRGEHQRVDPLCHVVWKRNGDRHGSEWVNTAELDAAIDAARAAKEQA